MRHLPGLFILSAVFVPLLAQPALAGKRPDAEASAPQHPRQTWQQHFTDANVSHDGHLTAAEAKGGFAQVAKHFDEIDVDHKGYVTEDDIRAWRLTRKAAHRRTKPPEDALRPRAAFQRVRPDAKPINASSRQKTTAGILPPPSES